MGSPDEVRNDPKNAVSQFCLAMETHRRTEAGRVRTAREMVDFFFPRGEGGAEDRIFFHLPPSVRGPIVSGWGIRGAKSAVRDGDEKVRLVIQDAFAAGDIDEAMFEDGVDATTLIDWVPLPAWWTFWRTGKLTGVAIQKALAVARELALFDDTWFLSNVDGRGRKLKGTDTLCDTLSKDQIVAWIRKLHAAGDGSPAGIVAALGWDTVLAKTSQEALLFALDALARKVGLATSERSASAPVPSSRDGVTPEGLGTDPMLAEARAAMMSPLTEDTPAETWNDVSSRNAPPPSDPPVSFGGIDDGVGAGNVTGPAPVTQPRRRL